jgi:hypothetical protein
MAYPFAKAPTVKEFVDKLKQDFNCTCEHLDGLVGPRGEVVISYLARKHNGDTLVSEPLPENKDERVSPDTLRRICAQLKADVKAFGLDLG